MVGAAERLLEEGRRDSVCSSWWAKSATARGVCGGAGFARFSLPDQRGAHRHKLALGSKGTLRYEIVAQGRMAHSAYPELANRRSTKLLDALEAIRRIPLLATRFWARAR